MKFLVTVASYVAGGIVLAVCAVAVLSVIGAVIEGVTDWQVEHERCLKRATNGYEIRRCR